jgi:release factor glutamine methyltransferase
LKARDALAGVSQELSRSGIDSHRIQAEILVSAVLGILDEPRVELLRAGARELSTAQARTLAALVLRRLSGEPVQYIVRRAWFRDLVLEVGPGVLVPRPETEVLTGEVIAHIGERPSRVVDVGTGSGCIALAIAAECPNATVVALDVSPEALRYAEINRERVEAQFPGTKARVQVLEGEGLASLFATDRFDVIVSNPPYVSEADKATLPRDVRDHEPHLALFASKNGLAMLEEIVKEAPERLVSGGLLALEVGDGQAETVAAKIAQTGAFDDPRIVPDLAGRSRVVLAERR